MTTVESLRGKELAVDARASGFVFILGNCCARMASVATITNSLRSAALTGVIRRYWRASLPDLPVGPVAAVRGQRRGAGLPPARARRSNRFLLSGNRGRRETVPWAEQNRDLLVSYIRAYVEATQWCFDASNRPDCLALLAAHNGLEENAAVQTLDALLDSDYGMYPTAAVNLPGVQSVLELRAEMGFLNPPLPPVEKYIDLSYYNAAIERR